MSPNSLTLCSESQMERSGADHFQSSSVDLQVTQIPVARPLEPLRHNCKARSGSWSLLRFDCSVFWRK